MQKDMHFYGTYAVARIAGFSPEQARIVATAAEFVDEAVSEADPVQIGNLRYLMPVVSAHKVYELRDNLDERDQWQVWVPFHFLPGGADGHIDERMICLMGEPGNPSTDAIINLALSAGASHKYYALHLLGVVTHVIQDTYAHYGFSGFSSDLNRIDQDTLAYYDVKEMGEHLDTQRESFLTQIGTLFTEATELGHAAVATYPDRPYLHWDFEYEKNPLPEVGYLHTRRNNPKTFYAACTRLHAIYGAFLEGMSSMEGLAGHRPFAESTELEIRSIIGKEGELKQRCDIWKSAIAGTMLFPSENGDGDVRYSENGWRLNAMDNNPFAATTDAAKFHGAASAYLHEVLGRVLPSMGLLA